MSTQFKKIGARVLLVGNRKFFFLTLLSIALLALGWVHFFPQHAQRTWARVIAAVDGPYVANNTLDYYVVTSANAAEDTGDEVCAALGLECIGYTNYDESVCTQVHPTADVDNTSVSGSRAGVYCDGAPQGGVCAGLTNTCVVCPTCNVGVSCSEPIGALYREMYVQCGGALGTNVYESIYRPDDNGSADFVATTLTDDIASMTISVVKNTSTEEDIPLFNDSFTDGHVFAVGADTVDNGLFVAHGHNDSGTGDFDLYITKLDSAGVDIWTTQIDTSTCYYCANGVIDMLEDTAGGVYVLQREGNVFSGPVFEPILHHLNASGTITYTVNTFDASNFIGRIVPDGSGGVILVTGFGFDPDFLTEGNGIVRRYTASGVDATWNGGAGEQSIVTIDNGNDRVAVEVISDGAGGIVVLWIGDEGSGWGVYGQHIESNGSIDGNWNADGELIAADDNAYTDAPIQAALAGSHVYFVYTDFSTGNGVVDEFFLDLSTAWVCQQKVAVQESYDIINPYMGNPTLVWTYDNVLYAQQYDAGEGHSLWSIGGEEIDSDDQWLNLAFGTPSTRGFGEEAGGVGFVYTIDEGATFRTNHIDSSSFAAGPGDDCVPVEGPEPVFPEDGAIRASFVVLSALYSSSSGPGVTHYRVSSGSPSDCVDGVSIVAALTSEETLTNTEPTVVEVGGLINGNTYSWCAQNDDGVDQSGWAEMGTFEMDTTAPDLNYFSYLPGEGEDVIGDVVIYNGIAYLVGYTDSTLDFPTTPGVYDSTNTGSNFFITAIDTSISGDAGVVMSTYLGSGSTQPVFLPVLAVDNSGIYMAGNVRSSGSDFPVTVGSYDTTYNGIGDSTDGVIAHLSLDGTSLLYATYLGGADTWPPGTAEQLRDIAVEGGLIYVVGQTPVGTFPTTAGAYSTVYSGGPSDSYVAVIDPSGNGAADLLYSTFIGGSEGDVGLGIAVDSGLIYVTGIGRTAFPTTAGSYDTSYNGNGDIFAAVIDPAGSGASDLLYSTFVGGSDSDQSWGKIAFDGVYMHITGTTTSTNFPVTAGAFDQDYNDVDGGTDGVYIVVNPSGTGSGDLIYSTYFGGEYNDEPNDITLLPSGSAVIVGGTYSWDFPLTANAFDTSLNIDENRNGYLIKLAPNGSGSDDLEYATLISSENETVYAVSVDAGLPTVVYGAMYLEEPYGTQMIPGFKFGGEPVDVLPDPMINVALFRIDLAGAPTVPSTPTLNHPQNGMSVSVPTPVLSARYLDGLDTGVTHYRISTSSLADCVDNVNIVSSGSSSTTTSISEQTYFQASGLSNNTTYYWCAQNDDGEQSAWTQMGTFVTDFTLPRGPIYSTFLGGTDEDSGTSIFVEAGEIIVAGTTSSTDFPSTTGVYSETNSGSSDIYVARIAPDGNGSNDLVYATFFGGSDDDYLGGMDYVSGNIHLFGTTYSADLPMDGGVGGNAFDTSKDGNGSDAFYALLSNNAADLDYSTYFGGEVSGPADSDDFGGNLFVDAGLVYLSGTTDSDDFPTTAGAYDTTLGDYRDMFFAVLDPLGNGSADLQYSTYFGSALDADDPVDIFVESGLIYVLGYTGENSSDIPTISPVGTPYQSTHGGGPFDGVFAIIDPSGNGSNDLIYSTYLGGNENEDPISLVVDGGTVYIVGLTNSSDFDVTAGAFDETFEGDQDGFVMILQPEGNGSSDLVYSTFLGGDGSLFDGDVVNDVMVLPSGNLVLTGATDSTNFPSTTGQTLRGDVDAFVALLDPSGNGEDDLIYADLLSGSGFDYANRLFHDGVYLYITGETTSSNYPTFAYDGTPYDFTFNGGADAFVTVVDLASLVNAPPSAPTILYVGDTDAQTGAANPNNITAGTPVFSAICNDPDAGDIMDSYQIQVDDNNDFTSILWDSGGASTPMANCVAGARSVNITYGGAPLPQDGTTYYWRIKFWDDDEAEGAFSEDPISTNTFTMATASGGGGGSSIQRIQQQSLSTPQIGAVTVFGHDRVQFEWTYTGTGHSGFYLLNEANQVVATVNDPQVRNVVESGLEHNTLVSGRKIAAFVGSTQGTSSTVFPEVYTEMIAVTPQQISRVDDRIRIGINEPLNNLDGGQSAVQFELIPAEEVSGSTIVTSEWIKFDNYVFTDTDSQQEYYVRVRGRNYDGVETPWSHNLLIRAQEFQAPIELLVDLRVMTPDGQNVQGPVNPNDLLTVEVGLMNNGALAAENVFLTVPLPPYMSYIPGTLVVNGVRQSEIPDGDVGQVTRETIAAIWPTLQFGYGHTVRFNLSFDAQRLITDFLKPTTIDESGGVVSEQRWSIDETLLPKETIRAPEMTREDLIRLLQNIQVSHNVDTVLKNALAAAGPLLQLQALASDDSTAEPTYSNPVVVQPELSVFEVPVVEPTEPEPAEEPVVAPTPEEVTIIEDILNPGPSTPSLPQGETTTTIGNGEFRVETQVGDGTDILGLTGQARVNEDQIEFTGTTTEPFTIVTLIFNENVTTVVVSDADGVWRTFVSAEQLGIEPGQSHQVRIEAVAAKGDLRSERVEVGTVNLVRALSGEITPASQPETLVSSSVVVRAVEQAVRQVQETIQEQEPAIQTSLAVVAPVVVATSVPLWGYLPYIPTLLYHFITYLLGAIGRKKKEDRRFYGIVYDSITKQPLPLAIIRIYNKETNKLVSTQVSDKQGRYEALLEPAIYRLEVTKPTYTFPSVIVTSEIDGNYQHIYQQEQGMAVQEQDLVIPDVPLDPVNAQRQWQLSNGIKKIWLVLQKVGSYLAVPILIIGSVASVLVVIAIPHNLINWVLAGLYIIMLVAQLKLHAHIQKAWGVVYDMASNAVLPLATIQLIDPQYGKVVTSRLSDYQGRYSFLPEPGKYVIKASKPGFEQVAEVVEAPKDRQPVTAEVTVDKPDQRITGDVPMKPI